MQSTLKTGLATLWLIAGINLSTQAFESEIWISPQGPAATNLNALPAYYPNTNVLGTATYPFRCTNGAALNNVLTNYLYSHTDLTIHFMAGTFEVLVNNYGINVGIYCQKGWKLRGAGIDNTILQLDPAAVLGSGHKTVVVGEVYSSTSCQVEVSDMTLDCNMQSVGLNQCVGGAELYGSDTRISRVKAINWGSGLNNAECFILYISAPGSGTQTNCVIEDCIITQPAPATHACGTTALYVVGEGAGAAGIIRNNMVHDITAGKSYSGSPLYFHAFAPTSLVTHNYVLHVIDGTSGGDNGSGCGLYSDTGAIQNCFVENNVFQDVSQCMFLNMPDLGVTNMTIRDNLMYPANNGSGIYFYHTSPNELWTNLVLANNVIAPADGAVNTTAFIFTVTNAAATVMNNVMQGNGTGLDLSVPWSWTPEWSNPNSQIFWNTWVNNVNEAGTQLTYSGAHNPGDEDSIIFSPTSSGWYRLIAAGEYSAGTIRLEAPLYGGNVTFTEFTYNVDGYTSPPSGLGDIVETIKGSYGVGAIDEARIASDCSANVYLDIHVPTGTGAGIPWIKITRKGPVNYRMETPPTIVTGMLCNSNTISL